MGYAIPTPLARHTDASNCNQSIGGPIYIYSCNGFCSRQSLAPVIVILPIISAFARGAGNPRGVRHIASPAPPSVLYVGGLASDAHQSAIGQNARR